MQFLEFTCPRCHERQPVAVACRWCDRNLSPMRRNMSGEVRWRLVFLLDSEAEMIRRRYNLGGGEAIADWIGSSVARRKRARTVLGLPKGYKWRTGEPTSRAASKTNELDKNDPFAELELTDPWTFETDQQSQAKSPKRPITKASLQKAAAVSSTRQQKQRSGRGLTRTRAHKAVTE